MFLTLELRAEALVAPGGLVSSAGRIPVRGTRSHGEDIPERSKAIVEGREEAKKRADDLRQVQKESGAVRELIEVDGVRARRRGQGSPPTTGLMDAHLVKGDRYILDARFWQHGLGIGDIHGNRA